MNNTMDNPDITYAIYIAATPEKLWKALTSPEALKKNWGRIESPWTVGSTVTPPVTEVAPNAPVVRLTLTQTGFQENSTLRSGCSRAWPEILSSVKTYLETGRPLPFVWKH